MLKSHIKRCPDRFFPG